MVTRRVYCNDSKSVLSYSCHLTFASKYLRARSALLGGENIIFFLNSTGNQLRDAKLFIKNRFSYCTLYETALWQITLSGTTYSEDR